MATHIVLVGMMGAGKTTVGRALAARLTVPYADNDATLAARAGVGAAAYAARSGLAALHRLEHDILRAAVARHDGAVISAAGSIALFDDAADVLRRQRVVWLRARLATLVERTRHDPVRPLLGSEPASVLAALMEEREAGFARVATSVVDVDGLSVDAVVDQVLAGT